MSSMVVARARRVPIKTLCSMQRMYSISTLPANRFKQMHYRIHMIFRGTTFNHLNRRQFTGNTGRHTRVTSSKIFLYGVPATCIGIGFYLIASRVIHDREREAAPIPTKAVKIKSVDGDDADEEKEDDEEEQDPFIYYLRVRVIDAEILHKYDIIGSADAYVQVGYDGRRRKTKAIKNTQNPRWDELFRFKRAKPGDKMSIWVWDYDRMATDDFIGKAVVEPEDLPTNFNEVKEITVKLQCPNSEDRGLVRLKVDFTRVNRI